MRPRLITVLGVILATSIACSQSEDANAPEQVVLRFIDSDPEVELRSSLIYDLEPVLEWRWTDRSDPAGWVGTDLRLWVFKRGGLQGTVQGPKPTLESDVAIEAEDVDLIEVEARRIGTRSLTLSWRSPDSSDWHPDHRVSATRSKAADGAEILSFELAGDPNWTGRISGLRLELSPGNESDWFKLITIRGLHRIVAADRLTETVARAWKVDLGNDMRNALLAPPGLNHDRTLRIPPDARLVAGFGAPASLESSVHFEIQVVSPDDGSVTLFNFELPPSSEDRWQRATVDLGHLAGEEITLRLVTTSSDPIDPTDGFPAWANPEVVAPAQTVPRPNVVVICLDTLRADGLSSYGNPLPTSPNIDSWAQVRGVRFANAVAPAPWTLPSHASMFTGLDAVRHGVNFSSAAPTDLEMLAERLRDHGYTTGAVTGGGYLGSSFGFIQGFDTFAYWPEDQSADEIKWVTEKTTDWLDGHSRRPFFLFVHTYEVHYPHRRRQPFFNRFAQLADADPPEGNVQMRNRGWEDLIAVGDAFVIRRPGSREWVDELTDDEVQAIRLMYHSAVAYADTKVRTILDHLANNGVNERTMVILTSDHGEALGEDGRAGHTYLDDFNLMVPLIIEFPGHKYAGSAIDRQVRLVDLVPTILETVGLPVPADLDGKSLVPLVGDDSAQHPTEAWAYAGSSNRGLALRIDNTTKYVFPDSAWSSLARNEALYDLRTDPDETTDLVGGDPRRDEFRARNREVILEQHNGYRLEIINQGGESLEGRLTGRWASHDRVKIADRGCDCVHWKTDARATFALSSGDRTELLFVDTRDFNAGITGLQHRSGGRPPVSFELEFQLDEITFPAAIEPVDGEWRLIEEAVGPPTVGFYLTLAGDLAPTSRAGAAPDEETLEQLRALGYVE